MNDITLDAAPLDDGVRSALTPEGGRGAVLLKSAARNRVAPVTFMTFAQACDALQLSEKTLRKLIATGELHACKVGAQWRIRSDDFENFGRHDCHSINAATSGTTASHSRASAIAARPTATARVTRASLKSANGVMLSWEAHRARKKTGV